MLSATAALRRDTPGANLLRTEVIEDVKGFTALRSQWNELLRSSAANCPFLTWEWLHAWWTHLHGHAELRLIVVSRDDQLVAIAPLLATRSRLGLFSQLEFLGTGCAGSDYLDVIVRPEYDTEALQAIEQTLDARRCSLHLKHVAPAALTTAAAEHLVHEGWTSTARQIAVCPYIPLTGHTWDTYLASLGASHRANFRRRLKGLHSNYSVRYEAASSHTEVAEALAALIAFHSRRWTTRGGSTAFQEQPLRTFHADVTRRAFDAGWLRMYILRLNDVPAAVMYGFLDNRRFYFYQHGFDDQYQQHSIGLVLMGLTIHSALDAGALEFDMLYGNEPYKSLWAPERRPLFDVNLFPPHAVGALHHRFVAAERTVRTFARRFRAHEDAHAA